METTIVYWGSIEIMEKKMETTPKRSYEAPKANPLRSLRGLGFRVLMLVMYADLSG